jgi:hypothetical protein
MKESGLKMLDSKINNIRQKITNRLQETEIRKIENDIRFQRNLGYQPPTDYKPVPKWKKSLYGDIALNDPKKVEKV